MILATKIKQKLYRYFTKRLGLFQYRRGWLKGDCPMCGDLKFGVNLSLNRTNCFKCGYHESPINVVMDVENLVDINQAKLLINELEGEKFYEEQLKPYELVENVVLPEGYKNIRRGNSYLAKSIRNFVIKRGFDINTVSRKGWGYCNKGNYYGYLIMPFYENNKLIYFNARRVVAGSSKFNNPNIEDFGIGKSMLIYNIDALMVYKRCFIFEGLMNAETIGDNAIAAGGKKLSEWQINKFIKSPVEKFVICLDGDAKKESFDLALKLAPYKKVKLVTFPEDKDANDLGRKKTLKLVNQFRYQNVNEIRKRKIQYEGSEYTHYRE